MQYVVAAGHTVWHSKEEKVYREGEKIDLSHLTQEQIDMLVKSGVIAVKTAKEK